LTQYGLLGSSGGFIKSVGGYPGLQFRPPEINRTATPERPRTPDNHERLVDPTIVHQLFPADQRTADFMMAAIGPRDRAPVSKDLPDEPLSDPSDVAMTAYWPKVSSSSFAVSRSCTAA
jgi:hypothetical protein